jgi:hypothetical protein
VLSRAPPHVHTGQLRHRACPAITLPVGRPPPALHSPAPWDACDHTLSSARPAPWKQPWGGPWRDTAPCGALVVCAQSTSTRCVVFQQRSLSIALFATIHAAPHGSAGRTDGNPRSALQLVCPLLVLLHSAAARRMAGGLDRDQGILEGSVYRGCRAWQHSRRRSWRLLW